MKDSHGTKTSPGTRETLSVVWAPATRPGHARAALEWYASVLESSGAEEVSVGMLGAPVEGGPAPVDWGL